MRLISDMKAKSILNYNARYRGLIVIGKSEPLRHMIASATG